MIRMLMLLRPMRTSSAGFTLVELSIVLVILGLLVGGVLAGQSLIHAAELRAILTTYDKFKTANNAFRDKYFFPPGDLPNATSYWGAANADPSTCINTSSLGSTATCNGNGDGRINYPNYTITSGSNEGYRYWQHLANAGLIAGNYSGIAGGVGSYNELILSTTNTPVISAPAKIYWFVWDKGVSGSATFAYDVNWRFDGYYGNSYYLTSLTNLNGPLGVLPAQDIYYLDKKMDDEKPGTGTLVIQNNNVDDWSCTNASNSTQGATATYQLSSTTLCALIFRNVF